jgi:hypothetical protein
VFCPARKSLPSSQPTLILATSGPGEIRALAVAGNIALDSAIERPGGPLGLDDQVVGRITARVPAMAGAFVALPGSSADGFLPDTAGAAGVSEGTHLRLRVSRGAQGGKGPRLAALPEPTEGPVRLLARGPGAVERLATLHPEAAIRVDRPGVAAALPGAFRPRVSVGIGDLAERTAALWSALAEPEVVLPNGARFTIWPTPALTAIDVDTGSATGEKRGKKEAQLALNRAVIPVIARHIRLRHLAGAILVDPAGLPQRQRPILAEAFQSALATDPLAPKFLGFSALGLAEIQRARAAPLCMSSSAVRMPRALPRSTPSPAPGNLAPGDERPSRSPRRFSARLSGIPPRSSSSGIAPDGCHPYISKALLRITASRGGWSQNCNADTHP